MMVEHFYHLIHFRAVTASSWISNQIFEVSLCLLYSVMWDCLITRANGLIDFSHIWEIMQCFSVQTPFNINLESILERLFWRMSVNPLTWTLKGVGAVVLSEFLHFFTIKTSLVVTWRLCQFHFLYSLTSVNIKCDWGIWDWTYISITEYKSHNVHMVSWLMALASY